MRIASIILITVFLFGCNSRVPDKTGKEGQPIPSFKFLLRDTVTHIFTSDIKTDKPVVIMYFGTHCPYSRATIQDIFDNIDDMDDIQFYMLTPDSLADLVKYSEAYHLYGFENLIVGQDCEYFLSNHFDVHYVPYTFIYGKDHKLKAAFGGQISSGDIIKYARE